MVHKPADRGAPDGGYAGRESGQSILNRDNGLTLDLPYGLLKGNVSGVVKYAVTVRGTFFRPDLYKFGIPQKDRARGEFATLERNPVIISCTDDSLCENNGFICGPKFTGGRSRIIVSEKDLTELMGRLATMKYTTLRVINSSLREREDQLRTRSNHDSFDLSKLRNLRLRSR